MQLILLVLAFACFCFGALQQTNPNWNRVISLGLAALVASMIPW